MCIGGRDRIYGQIVHNYCVQIGLGRVGGEANLANDHKYAVFFSDNTPYAINHEHETEIIKKS